MANRDNIPKFAYRNGGKSINSSDRLADVPNWVSNQAAPDWKTKTLSQRKWIQLFPLMLYCYIYTGRPGRNVSDFGRMCRTLKYTDITQNTYIRSWTVTEIMAREKCSLLAVPRTVPVWCVVTRTLRMSVLQSHSRVKHIPTSLSTDVTVTVNCNSILLDIHVPCKVLGNLRTTTTLVRVCVV